MNYGFLRVYISGIAGSYGSSIFSTFVYLKGPFPLQIHSEVFMGKITCCMGFTLKKLTEKKEDVEAT